MTEEVKEFFGRLKTFKNKACDERVTILTVYNRVRKGVYQTIEIDGVKFIVEPKSDKNECKTGQIRNVLLA